MTHGHEELRNTRTIRLQGKSGLCVRPGVSSERQGAGPGQCRVGGNMCCRYCDGSLYVIPGCGMACTAPAPAPTPAPVPAVMRKAWSVVDARKAQTHAAHRPTGSTCGENQTMCARSLLSFDLLPCGSWWVRTQESKRRSTTLSWYQCVKHRSSALLQDSKMQGPHGLS